MTDELIAAMGRPALPNLRPARPAPAPPAAPAPASPAEDQATRPVEAPPRRPRPRREQREPTRPEQPRTVSTRIPASLFLKVNEARDRGDETHEMWFLRVWAAVDDQLDAYYRVAEPVAGRVPQRTRRRRRAAAEPLVQYPLRLSGEEARVLNERCSELRPSSMSELVTTIVRLGLEVEPDGDRERQARAR